MDHKQPFNKRVSDTTSEDKFEKYCKDKNILFYKYGIDNHPFGKNLAKIKREIRNTPDYIIQTNSNAATYFVEVKGCKSEVGLKILDLKSYDFWNKLIKVYYYIYSVTFNETKLVSHPTLKKLVKGCKIKQYHDFTAYDDKKYYEIPFKELKR